MNKILIVISSLSFVFQLYGQKPKSSNSSHKSSNMIRDYSLSDLLKGQEVEESPYENAMFSLDDSKTLLKLDQHNSRLFIYTLGVKSYKISNDYPPVLLVTQSVNEYNLTPKKIAELSISKMKKSEFDNIEIKKASHIRINKYKGYEVKLKYSSKGKIYDALVQTIVKGNKQILFQGVLRSDKYDFKVFKELINTIQLKSN